MCGRFVYKGEWETLQTEFPGLSAGRGITANFNAAPTQRVPVLLWEDGGLRLEAFQWGLIPFWAKDPAIGSRLINARAETVAQKPAFKGLLKRRRCLLLANGFYEWVKEGKAKIPYFIYLKGQPLFGMAGLWDEWKDPAGEPVRSCAIITTEANAFMKPMHHRMPVILPREQWEPWLKGTEADADHWLPFLAPCPADAMACHTVARTVNSPAFNSPACIEPALLSRAISR